MEYPKIDVINTDKVFMPPKVTEIIFYPKGEPQFIYGQTVQKYYQE